MKRRLLVLFTLVASWQVSCLSLDDPDSAALRGSLEQFQGAATATVDGVVAVINATEALQNAITADDNGALDTAALTLAERADALEVAVTDLDNAEGSIEDALGGEGVTASYALQQPILPLLGWGIAAAGLYFYTSTLKSLNAEMSAARTERDAADPGSEAHTAAKAKMKDVGSRAITHITTNVTTELVTAPLGAAPKAIIQLVDLAGNALPSGKDVVGATDGCKDPSAGGCKIFVNRTGAEGKVAAPAGTVHASVSGQRTARAIVKDLPLQADEVKVVKVPQHAIDEVTADVMNGTTSADPTPTGAGSTSSDSFPANPEQHTNGHIAFTVTGAALGSPTEALDESISGYGSGFISWREYGGTVDGSTLRVSGTATTYGSHPLATEYGDFTGLVDVSVTVDGNTQTFHDETEASEADVSPWSTTFDISVPVPAGASSASFVITVNNVNPRFGDRRTEVRGSLTGP